LLESTNTGQFFVNTHSFTFNQDAHLHQMSAATDSTVFKYQTRNNSSFRTSVCRNCNSSIHLQQLPRPLLKTGLGH
jgi:hypothetical protein